MTTYTASTPKATVSPAGADIPEYVFEGPFSMKLTATDDKPGYVVPEFRVDGDGWQNFYGWPTDANAPFQFSVTGTDIDVLNYGKLAYGHHMIEYRAIDAAGNIATAKKFALTYLDPEKSEVGSGRRHGAGDALASARRRAGHVRRVHAGPGEGLHGEHGRRRRSPPPATPR